MKKRLFILAALLTMSVFPLAACGQNDTTERDRIKIQQEKHYQTPIEDPPKPETCPDACPDCGEHKDRFKNVVELEENSSNDKEPQGDDSAPNEQPPEFIKPPELRRNFKDRLPRRIGTFGFVLIMPSPEQPSNARNMPSPDDRTQENQNTIQENS